MLERVNETLCSEIPPNMFVTCLYGVLDPATGLLRYANAGHNLPIVAERRRGLGAARDGMPLGLMPGMSYEEKEATLAPGSSVLLYSDGLTEAHDPDREMFGTPRVRELLAGGAVADELIAELLASLDRFTGAEGEQEDDITLVALARTGAAAEHGARCSSSPCRAPRATSARRCGGWPRRPRRCGVEPARLERLKTADAEATMNAMEHGNRSTPIWRSRSRVARSDAALSVRITDHGGGREIPAAETPDIEAKLDGQQSPRGWGLFLIQNMVDEVRADERRRRHTLELDHAPGGRR